MKRTEFMICFSVSQLQNKYNKTDRIQVSFQAKVTIRHLRIVSGATEVFETRFKEISTDLK